MPKITNEIKEKYPIFAEIVEYCEIRSKRWDEIKHHTLNKLVELPWVIYSNHIESEDEKTAKLIIYSHRRKTHILSELNNALNANEDHPDDWYADRYAALYVINKLIRKMYELVFEEKEATLKANKDGIKNNSREHTFITESYMFEGYHYSILAEKYGFKWDDDNNV